MKTKFALFFIAIFLHSSLTSAATSNWQENQSHGAKTRLIASFYQDKQGKTRLIAGIHFKIARGWKIYGHGSDSVGLPPAIDFSKIPNFGNYNIHWPRPIIEREKFGDQSFTYNTYKGELILPISIQMPDMSKPLTLDITLDYGLCKDVCVPATESFILEIPHEADIEALHSIQAFFPERIVPTTTQANSQSKNYDLANQSSNDYPMTLIWMLLLAVMGGLILNIMPCVLPVLSIKLLSIIEHSNAKISRIRFSFIATILGILSCFTLFAFLAAAIKLTGNSLGWGLQFQNPYFLIFLILILVIFTINLLGLFEINFSQTLATFLDKKINKGEKKHNIFIPNFLSGILAVLLATPCSAPFLGAAISFALVENIFVIFLMFIAIGIGFAAPYFILLAMPQLVKKLPKPGNWMNHVKKLMALLLGMTVIWLLYILANNMGPLPALSVAILAIILVSCGKIKSNLLRYIAIILTISLLFSLPSDLPRITPQTHNNERYWQDFDEMEIHKQVAKGNVVIIDITADWCITCKFNKLRVLHSQKITDILSQSNIIAMRGDITKPNPDIMKYLGKNNRFAIPFNAVYGPNAKKGLLASELLSTEELLTLIRQAQ